MRFEAEVLAPWMPQSELTGLIDSLLRVDPRYNRLGRDEAGQRLRLTNAERERLRAWRIAPVDMTAELLAEQRKAKDRARKAARRRQADAKPRAEYLALTLSKQKPGRRKGSAAALGIAGWHRSVRDKTL